MVGWEKRSRTQKNYDDYLTWGNDAIAIVDEEKRFWDWSEVTREGNKFKFFLQPFPNEGEVNNLGLCKWVAWWGLQILWYQWR